MKSIEPMIDSRRSATMACVCSLCFALSTYAQTAPFWDNTPGNYGQALSWSPAASIESAHHILVAKDGALYAVGTDAVPPSQPYNAIYRWTECSGWQWFAGFTSTNGGGAALAMYIRGSFLYVGGYFDFVTNSINNTLANNLVKCNLTTGQWSAVGDGSLDRTVLAVVADDAGNVYVGHPANGSPGTLDAMLRIWNGASWAALGGGLVKSQFIRDPNPCISALGTDGTNIYVGGTFDGAYNGTQLLSSYALIKWDGSQWISMVPDPDFWSHGVDPFEVYWYAAKPVSIAVSGPLVFVCGDNTTYNGFFLGNSYDSPNFIGITVFSNFLNSVSNVVQKQGLLGHDLFGDQVYGSGYSVAELNGIVYLCGNFDGLLDFQTSAVAPANGVAQFTNGVWLPMGSGLTQSTSGGPGMGTDLATDANGVLVSGIFDTAGGQSSTTFARWITTVHVTCGGGDGGGGSGNSGVKGLVAAGRAHAIAAKKDGTVWTWGAATANGFTTNVLAPKQFTNIHGVVAVSAGDAHSLALKYDGTLWAWGVNTYGQLGDGTQTTSLQPVRVSGISNIISVSGGGQFSLALKSDGTVWAWGRNQYAGVGDGTTAVRLTAVQLTALSGIRSISCGYWHGLALDTNGAVLAWGYNTYGQVGDGTTTARLSPVSVSTLPTISLICAGAAHNLALQTNGNVWAWGWNQSWGQIGDGTTNNRPSPVQLTSVTGIRDLAAGGYHSLAVTTNGTLYAYSWGSNHRGQLGIGNFYFNYVPTPGCVENTNWTPVTNAMFVVAGPGAGESSYLIRQDGSLWGWGYNLSGQVGDGTGYGNAGTYNRWAPVSVIGF